MVPPRRNGAPPFTKLAFVYEKNDAKNAAFAQEYTIKDSVLALLPPSSSSSVFVLLRSRQQARNASKKVFGDRVNK